MYFNTFYVLRSRPGVKAGDQGRESRPGVKGRESRPGIKAGGQGQRTIKKKPEQKPEIKKLAEIHNQFALFRPINCKLTGHTL